MKDGVAPGTVRGVNPNPDRTGDDTMPSFVARHRHQIQGTLSGFDRPRFVGSLLRLSYVRLEDVGAGLRRGPGMEPSLAALEVAVATVFGLRHQTSPGTATKNSKAATRPWRIASVRSKGSATTKGAWE